MRGAMSRLAAATLVAICLSMLPSPLHATRGVSKLSRKNMRSYTVSSTRLMAPPRTTQLHHKKATAAKVKSHSGAGASSSASSLGRLLAYDLPLPHDWIRQVREVPGKGKRGGND